MINKLYYFYSQHCWPCRLVSPIIDKLNSEWANIEKVDTGEDDGYAKAVSFDLMQTPSIVIVNNNLGGQKAFWFFIRFYCLFKT